MAAIVGERYGIDLNDVLGLHYFESEKFKLYQLFTYMFMHSGFEHIFFNMFAVLMFAPALEDRWGGKRFLIYYLACGIGAGLVQLGTAELDLLRMPVESIAYQQYLWTPTVGASGAVYGLLLAFGVLHPNNVIMLIFPPIAMKAKWFVVIYGLLELFFGLSGYQAGVAHFAHLGGMLWGLALLLWSFLCFWEFLWEYS